MNLNSMPPLRIGDLEIPVPVVQGGMGVGISLANLASAVADNGGIGVISSVGIGLIRDPRKGGRNNCEALREEIRLARRRSHGVVGVNIMVALTDFDDLVATALKSEVDILFLGAGLVLKPPKNLSLSYLRSVKTKIVPIVSSPRAVRLMFGRWEKLFNHVPDAVVVEGPKAGGHLGFKKNQLHLPAFQLEELVPRVCRELEVFEERFQKKIPVIAAGGIYSGRDIARFFRLGAGGVQMGTRFVATEECDASEKFKQAYVTCSPNDIVVIDSPVGLPGRAIRSSFLKEMAGGYRKPSNCVFKCLKTCNFASTPYCIANALLAAQKGKFQHGFAFAGANVFRIDKILSVKNLLNSLIREFQSVPVPRGIPC